MLIVCLRCCFDCPCFVVDVVLFDVVCVLLLYSVGVYSLCVRYICLLCFPFLGLLLISCCLLLFSVVYVLLSCVYCA